VVRDARTVQTTRWLDASVWNHEAQGIFLALPHSEKQRPSRSLDRGRLQSPIDATPAAAVLFIVTYRETGIDDTAVAGEMLRVARAVRDATGTGGLNEKLSQSS
jgi:hypothetical protein